MKKEHCHCLLFILMQLLLIIYSKISGLSYLTAYLYQIVTFLSSAWLLKIDFNFFIFKDQQAFSIKKIIIGVACGFGFAVAIIVFFALVREVTLFPQYVFEMTCGGIVNQIIFQLFVALAEECMFRFYLYEALVHLMIPKWIVGIILSLSFAWAHLFMQSGWIPFGTSLIFSLFAFLIKIKNRDNLYIQLVMMHFIYDLCCCFIFSIQ